MKHPMIQMQRTRAPPRVQPPPVTSPSRVVTPPDPFTSPSRVPTRTRYTADPLRSDPFQVRHVVVRVAHVILVVVELIVVSAVFVRAELLEFSEVERGVSVVFFFLVLVDPLVEVGLDVRDLTFRLEQPRPVLAGELRRWLGDDRGWMRMVSEVSDGDGEKGRRRQRFVFWDGPIRGCIASSPSAVWCIATDTRLRDVEGRRGDREPGELNRGIGVGARVRGRWDRARSPPLSSSP
jgi:hypothetical protein